MTSDDYAEKAERYREISVNTLAHNERLMGEIEKLKDENAKLRDLVRHMWHDIPKHECGWSESEGRCTGGDECNGECGYWYRMRDLGIEVDDDD